MHHIRLSQITTPFLNNPLENPVQYFTQFNIHMTQCTDALLTEHYCIDTRDIKLHIFSAKFIPTPEGTSAEGQHLTGNKLTLMGNACITLLLRHRQSLHKHHVLKCAVPFSTFIIVPKIICDPDYLSLAYFIEDLSILRLAPGKIFISITLLIHYQEFI